MPSQDFAESLLHGLGRQAASVESVDEFAQSMLTKHPSALRMRWGLSQDDVDFPLRPIAWYRQGYESTDPSIRPSRQLSYAAGDYYLQDAGSMLAMAACETDQALPEGEAPLICDLCASPGGKATALLENLGGGFLLANEPIRSRLAPLAFNLARTGIPRYAISAMDPSDLADQLGGVFDRVVVDAPCSGQALLGRGKQSLAALTQTQIEHSAARAQRILAAAVKLLRPGGKLVFSTCTFAEQENENQVDWMIDHCGMLAAPIDRLLPYESHHDSKCAYRLWPHRHQCAGSFAASLIAGFDVASEGVFRERKKKRKGKPSATIPDAVAEIVDPASVRLKESEVILWGWPVDAPAWVESVAESGPELAYRTGQTWKPSHHLARRRDLDHQAVFDVDADIAAKYLAGEAIACDQKGWLVVRHGNRGLGWIKASGGTGKNHLPVSARS